MMRCIITVGLLLFMTGTWSSLSGQVESVSLRLTETEQNLHAKCIEAEQRAERQAAEMVPGRTWTWALDAQQSLQQLNQLKRDLEALRECEAGFEASLSPAQVTKYQTQLHRVDQLSQHLERDALSLENELTKERPRRWHVAHDALDMRRELEHWRKLHEMVDTGVSTVTSDKQTANVPRPRGLELALLTSPAPDDSMNVSASQPSASRWCAVFPRMD